MMTEIIIFDTEYTTWEGAQDRQWSGDNEYREVVQIGAIKVDWPSGDVIAECNLFVKPKINPTLSNYFQKLTHITQQHVDMNGMDFQDALKAFITFCGSNNVYSYGRDDFVLAENIALSRCDYRSLYSWDAPEFFNIARMINKVDPSVRERKVVSGLLWRHYGLEKPKGSGEHDALFDCYSILAALKHLSDKKEISL